MIPVYKPNLSLITKKISKIVNDLYWLISNSGSSMQYPKIELGRDKTTVNRHLVNLLTGDEKNYIAYLAFMYSLDEDRSTVVHFKAELPDSDVAQFPDMLNNLVKGILNSNTLLSDEGVVLNRDNFIKYVGLISYLDQYDIDSVELSLFKMMINDVSIPPSTYEGIRLLEINDFLGDFLNNCKRPYS